MVSVPLHPVRRATTNFILELDFEAAAILYGISNLLSKNHSYLKDMGVLLWMAATGMDIHRTYQGIQQAKQVAPAPSSVVIEEIPDNKEHRLAMS